jgi:uncharacterized membrane protein YczE
MRRRADTEAVNARDQLQVTGRWIVSRAWSRAGAIAEVLAAGAPRRALARTSQVALFAVGALLIASAVAVMLWNQLGPGPLDVFIGAIRSQTGLPLMLSIWVTIGAMLIVSWVLGRRPGPGSVVGPLVIGPIMQFALTTLEHFAVPSSLAIRIAIQILAIAAVGIGAGSLIVSGLGAGSGELLASAASDRSGHPEPRTRLAFEVTWIVLGVALGGPIGIGTVLVAALIGPAVARGHRLVESVVVTSRRQLDVLAAPEMSHA